MRTLLIIPAYNEAECIERVVDRLIAEYSDFDYVVVNDGSTDATCDICRRRGYRFIDLPVNLGLAGAFQAGVKFAKKCDYDCIIQFDADGQHRPEYLSLLVEALDSADIVIGSRFIDSEKPHSLRMLGSNLISAMIKLTTGKRIKDPTSGMRAYGRRAIAELATGPNLAPEPDTLSYLMAKKGLRVIEVPVQMDERIAGTSYFGVGSSISYMMRMALSVLFMQVFR